MKKMKKLQSSSQFIKTICVLQATGVELFSLLS